MEARKIVHSARGAQHVPQLHLVELYTDKKKEIKQNEGEKKKPVKECCVNVFLIFFFFY
jgi:hypothetical protein